MQHATRLRMAESVVELTWSGRVAVITLNRPAKLNAVNGEMAVSLVEALAKAASRARALVLTGAGGNFSAGWDLSEPGQRGFDARKHPAWRNAVAALATHPLPTVAGIEGYCLGQGLLYAICCDFRIGAEDATLGFPEIRRGFFPGSSASQRIVRLIGRSRAKELMFFGSPISATQASQWGLLNCMSTPRGAVSAAIEWGTKLAKLPPKRLAEMKQMLTEDSEANQRLPSWLAAE
jgi:enoyl-CoA hydratase/carnithine racemase